MQRPLIAAFGALCLLAACSAPKPSLRDTEAPAELPPPGYAAGTYVDSRGCVFIRSGDAETVIWVPQVTLDRSFVCGFEPSLPGDDAAG